MDENLRLDPYPRFRWYRENDPIHCLEPTKPAQVRRYLLTRWQDVEAGLKDSRLGREVHDMALWNQAPETIAPEFASYARVLRVWPLFKDPPRHAMVRRPVNRILDQAMLVAAEPILDEVVDGMLDRLPPHQECDLIPGFASLVPLELDRRLFGLDDIDAPALGIWLQRIGLALGNVFDQRRIEEASRAIDSVSAHLEESIRRCRAGRGDAPMLRRLLELAGPAGMIAEEEIIPLAILLLQAAQDSVIGALSNGLVCFLRHPKARQRCLEVEGGFPRAVEEVLRFESPVQQVTRHAKVDLEIGGVGIRAGEGVSFLLGAANRDPAVFDRPDDFDVTRVILRSASFGFCHQSLQTAPGVITSKCTTLDDCFVIH